MISMLTLVFYIYYLFKSWPATLGCTEKFIRLLINHMEKGEIYIRTHTTRTDTQHTHSPPNTGLKSLVAHLKTYKHVLVNYRP